MLSIEAKTLLEKLNGYRTKSSNCEKVYCTTCGGRAAHALSNKLELYDEVASALSQITLDELEEFGEWIQVLEQIDYGAVTSVYLRAARLVDESDIRELDRYLLQASRLKSPSTELDALYQAHLDAGIKAVIGTGDRSLLETLVLVLGEDILKNNELLSLALARKSEQNVARALYNKLRNVLPEVRDYVGDK